jgi:uncharacterized membrane protein
MTNLLAAATFFVLLHLLVSGTRMRDALTGRIGQGPYLGLFVVLSWIGLIWLGWSYAAVRHTPANLFFWGATPTRRAIQIALQVVALLFIVIGITTRNPTMVRGEANLARPDLIRGMLRVTRHPFLWGVAIWACGHLIVNGDLASLVLFGSLFVLAIYGTVSIDAKRRRALGSTWDGFAAQTSNVPFSAIVAGRQRLSLAEIGWQRVALAAVVCAALAWAHPLLFGVRALP